MRCRSAKELGEVGDGGVENFMPGAGRPGDPLWFAIGFAIGILPGFYFHQVGLGAVLGLVLGGTLGLIRADATKNYRRPADPLWFATGLFIGILPASASTT